MSGDVIDDFHEHTIKLIQEMMVERDLEKSKVAVQNEVLKTKEALQIALFNSKSKHVEQSAEELSLKAEIDAWKEQSKLQESDYREAERLLRAEIQQLDEQYKEEHFSAVRAQAEYTTALQKARADHSAELASAHAELTSLKEKLATVTKQQEATNPRIEQLVTEHLADERAMEVRHKAQCNELQHHIDCMLVTHQKDLQELAKQYEEARAKLVLDHQRHLKEQEESAQKAIQTERRTVRSTMLKEQQKQQIALQEAEENLNRLQETLCQIADSTSSFLHRRGEWESGQVELNRLMREIKDVSNVARAAMEESASMSEAYNEQKRQQVLAKREIEMATRELMSRDAEVQQLLKQLQRREEEEERIRARSHEHDAQIARLQLELERNEMELSRVREELSACRGGGMESDMQVLGKSLALSRELVLKERELKGVEAKLRESEQAVARLEVIADEREAEESSWYAVSGSDAASVSSARAILAAFKPGELDFLCQEVEELRQKVQEKEEEVQHWQGEGMAAEEGMGHAIRALQESKARVEQEIELRHNLQTELDNVQSAVQVLNAELAAIKEAESHSQRELTMVSGALQHARAQFIGAKEKRAQRKASSAVLREWARVAVGEVDQEAYELLKKNSSLRKVKRTWDGWVCERLRAERRRVAGERVSEKSRGRIAGACMGAWVEEAGVQRRWRSLCSNAHARRHAGIKARVMGLWQHGASRRRAVLRMALYRPGRVLKRAWRRWTAGVRGARHQGTLRKQALRCIRTLSLRSLYSAWTAWVKAVEVRHTVSSMAAPGLMERIATTLQHVIRLWLRHVGVRQAAKARLGMLEQRQRWRRMWESWAEWHKAAWCASHRARWLGSAAASVCSAARRRYVSVCWHRWQAACHAARVGAACTRRATLLLARTQTTRWKAAAIDSADMRRHHAKAAAHATKRQARQALRNWAGEWRRGRKQRHGSARLAWRRRKGQLARLFGLWAFDAVAARVERETARAQTVREETQAAKSAFEKDVRAREKGWELVESKMLRDLRRMEAAAWEMRRDLAEFPMEQAEEAVERARRQEEQEREKGKRLAAELELERRAREIEEEDWQREREQREVREQRLRRERDDAEGLLAAFRVGCEGAVARIDLETKQKMQALAKRVAEAERARAHSEAAVSDLNAKLLAQRRALVSLAQHRANADCETEPLPTNVSPSDHSFDHDCGTEPRAQDLDQYLGQASRSSARSSRAMPVGMDGYAKGGSVVLESVSEEEEEVFGVDGSEEGVAGLSDALRALEKHRAERERMSGRLREALVSNKLLSEKNRQLLQAQAVQVQALRQQHVQPTSAAKPTRNANNPFDAEA